MTAPPPLPENERRGSAAPGAGSGNQASRFELRSRSARQGGRFRRTPKSFPHVEKRVLRSGESFSVFFFSCFDYCFHLATRGAVCQVPDEKPCLYMFCVRNIELSLPCLEIMDMDLGCIVVHDGPVPNGKIDVVSSVRATD